METVVNTIPGYRVYEYLLVVGPHQELGSRIMKLKEEFAMQYKSDHARWGKPQVALVTFKQLAMMEERIVNRLKTVAMGYPAIQSRVEGFWKFPFSHYLY